MQMVGRLISWQESNELSNLLVCNDTKKVVGDSEKSNDPVPVNMVHAAIAAVQVTAGHISGQTGSRSPSGNHLLEILLPTLTKIQGLDDASRPSHGRNDHFQVIVILPQLNPPDHNMVGLFLSKLQSNI